MINGINTSTKDILVIDDSMSRQSIFRSSLIRHNVTQAYTAIDAIQALVAKKFDVVFFDHDLGDDDKTGHDVAKWMAKIPLYNRPNLCVVHSLNPYGASNIMLTLRAQGYEVVRQPFDGGPVRLPRQ